MSKYLERKIKLYFECYSRWIDEDSLELLKASKIVNGVLTFPDDKPIHFKKIDDFNDTTTIKKKKSLPKKKTPNPKFKDFNEFKNSEEK